MQNVSYLAFCLHLPWPQAHLFGNPLPLSPCSEASSKGQWGMYRMWCSQPAALGVSAILTVSLIFHGKGELDGSRRAQG